jgi:hypothetical protein
MALSDVAYKVYNVLGYQPNIEWEDEERKYFDGFTIGMKDFRVTFEIKTFPIRYPETLTTIETFFGLTVWQKQYKWITFPSGYNLALDAMETGGGWIVDKALAVDFAGVTIDEPFDGFKQVTFKLKKRTLGHS